MRIAALGSVGLGGPYVPTRASLRRHVVEHRVMKRRNMSGLGALEPMTYSQIFAWASVVTGVGLVFWMVTR